MNKAMKGAKAKGALARIYNHPKDWCPYRDVRTNYRNGVTFSRAFMRAWHDGWDEMDEKIKKGK